MLIQCGPERSQIHRHRFLHGKRPCEIIAGGPNKEGHASELRPGCNPILHDDNTLHFSYPVMMSHESFRATSVIRARSFEEFVIGEQPLVPPTNHNEPLSNRSASIAPNAKLVASTPQLDRRRRPLVVLRADTPPFWTVCVPRVAFPQQANNTILISIEKSTSYRCPPPVPASIKATSCHNTV